MIHRLTRSLAVLAVVATLVTGVHAATTPAEGDVDARVRTVAYDQDDVVVLRGYVGYQVHIEWAEGEEFVSLGSGDNGAFDIGAERNHFFIKPKETQAATNLTIITNRRAYHFDYSVGAKPAAGSAAAKQMVFSLRYTYPQEEAAKAQAAADKQALEKEMRRKVAARPVNVDYWFCGHDSLKPTQASDDGVQTRLRFPSQAEFPALFVQNDDGSESLLNFHVDDGEVVIHRTARRLVLRRGQLVGCVVNRAYQSAQAGQGRGQQGSAATHTSSTTVERTTRGAQP